MGYVFPDAMFNKGSDLTPLSEHMEEFLAGLTEWTPTITEKGLFTPDMITITAKSYKAAEKAVNNYFIRNLWRDSLPIEPPTKELVDWILTGTDMEPGEVICEAVPPRGGICTVRDVAISLAMAGGRPEYLPFMIAATSAVTDPAGAMQSWNATTCSVYPVFIVDGPAAHDIRLGSGYGMLGADPAHPAGQTMGRAIRLIQQNLGGATPGSGTMAIYGLCRSTNAFFAEDIDGLPEGWKSLAEDRGFAKGTNVVTVTVANGVNNVLYDFGDDEANKKCLNIMGGCMASPNKNRYLGSNEDIQTTNSLPAGTVLMARAMLQALQTNSGMDKSAVKKYLWEHSKVSMEKLQEMAADGFLIGPGGYMDENGMVAVTPTFEQITIVCGGGDQGGHGCWMPGAAFGRMVSREIKLPKKWDDLLLDAEIDLGPIPSTH